MKSTEINGELVCTCDPSCNSCERRFRCLDAGVPLPRKTRTNKTPSITIGYAKMQPIEGSSPLPMDEIISVGFGSAILLRDGKPIWYESPDFDYHECLSVKQAESMAAIYPESDWLIHLVGPLSESYYQRHGKKTWVLYKQGKGFA